MVNGSVKFFSVSKNFYGKNIVEYFNCNDLNRIPLVDIFGESHKFNLGEYFCLDDISEKCFLGMKLNSEIIASDFIDSRESFFSIDFNVFFNGDREFNYNLNGLQYKPGIFLDNWVKEDFFKAYIESN